MARTVCRVAANLCPVDAEEWLIHSSVSCKFAKRRWSALVIPGRMSPLCAIMWK